MIPNSNQKKTYAAVAAIKPKNNKLESLFRSHMERNQKSLSQLRSNKKNFHRNAHCMYPICDPTTHIFN